MFERVRRLLDDTGRFSEKYHDDPRKFISANNSDSPVIPEHGDDIREEDIYFFLKELLSTDKHCFILTSFIYDVLRLNLPGYELMNASISIGRKQTLYTKRIRTLYDLYCYRKNLGKIESFNRFLEIIAGKCIIRIVIDINRQSDFDTAKSLLEDAYYYNDRKTMVCYLTRFGNVPGCNDDMNVICISFSDDIMRWLSYCINQSEIKNDLHARRMLLQFQSMVSNVIRHSEDIMLHNENDTDIEPDDDYDDVVDLILSSPENMNAALEIQDSMLTIRDELREKLFDAVRKKLDFGNINIEDFISVGEKGYVCVRSSPMSMWKQCRIPYSDNPNFKYPNHALMRLYDERNFDSFVNFCFEKIARNY